MMMTRRETVAAFALFAEMIAFDRDAAAHTQTPATPAPRRGPRSSSTICRTCRWTAGKSRSATSTTRPAASAPSTTHAGFVLAYVLEGLGDHQDLRPGRGTGLQDRRDVLRAAGRDTRGVEEREPDRPAKLLAMIFRQEGLDTDDSRERAGGGGGGEGPGGGGAPRIRNLEFGIRDHSVAGEPTLAHRIPAGCS